MKPALLFFLMLAGLAASAQPEQYNWYLGGIYGINFANGRQVLPPHPDNLLEDLSGGIPSSISDPVTGQFLFQANGTVILDRDFNAMPGAGAGKTAIQTTIVQDGLDLTKYIVVYSRQDSIFSSVVDMTLRGGRGDVIILDRLYDRELHSYFTVVRNPIWEHHELRAHAMKGDEYRSYHIEWQDGSNPYVTWGGGSLAGQPGAYGNVVSSRSGSLIGFSALFDDPFLQCRIELVKMSACSGMVRDVKRLKAEITGNPEPIGATLAFSQMDHYLFACVMGKDLGNNYYQEVWRYNLADPDPDLTKLSFGRWNVVKEKYGSIAVGPDGKIYVNSWELSDGRLHVSVIHNPEGPFVSMERNAFSFSGLNPSPVAKKIPFPDYMRDTFESNDYSNFDYGCYGDSASFTIHLPSLFFYDSVRWDFGNGESSSLPSGRYLYPDKGDFHVTLNRWYCGSPKSHTSGRNIRIQEKPLSNLNGKDTLLCAGAKMMLTAEKGIDAYFWNTRDTTWSIVVDTAGTYAVVSMSGKCYTYDTMRVGFHPPIWVELGGEHYLCEDDSQTVALDAGKGFTHYYWTPTEDTTQWIIVRRSGDYYVIVEDFNGCSAEDGTIVERRCDHFIEIPNAFTPNGDGLNDVFSPVSQELVSYSVTLYNRWGERIYTSEEPQQGWDGSFRGAPSPEGVYYYHIAYTGYLDHKLRKRTVSGVVHLLR